MNQANNLQVFYFKVPCTVQINCSSGLKDFGNSHFTAFSLEFSKVFHDPDLEQFFLTVGPNNFRKKYH